MAKGFGTPLAYVALVDGDRLVLLAHQGLPEVVAGRMEVLMRRSAVPSALQSAEPTLIDDLGAIPDLSECVERIGFGASAFMIAPLALPDGEVIGALCAGRPDQHVWDDEDRAILTDLAAAATLILRHRDMIHAIGALMSGVSQLVTPVRALTEQVRRLNGLVANNDDPRVRTIAALAGARVREVEELLHAAETMARTARTRVAAEPVTTDVFAIVRRSLDRALGAEAETADVRGAETPVTARCDPLELERSLTALLVSVRQFAAGSEDMQLRLLEGATKVRIAIRDQGHGIPASELARLLASFELVGSETAASFQTAHGVVTAERGYVRATSSPDGTSFEITLPKG
jgi:signal transduction histidine kinase